MAKDALIKIFIIFFLILFAFGLLAAGFFKDFGFLEVKEKETRIEDIEIVEFKTDKEIYGSYEKITFFIKIFSPENIKNAKIEILGIKPYQYAYINELKILDLLRDENNIEILSQTPYCASGCGGVYPGPYNIELFVFVEEKPITESELTISLVSR